MDNTYLKKIEVLATKTEVQQSITISYNKIFKQNNNYIIINELDLYICNLEDEDIINCKNLNLIDCRNYIKVKLC